MVMKQELVFSVKLQFGKTLLSSPKQIWTSKRFLVQKFLDQKQILVPWKILCLKNFGVKKI